MAAGQARYPEGGPCLGTDSPVLASATVAPEKAHLPYHLSSDSARILPLTNEKMEIGLYSHTGGTLLL